jgi:hypothetical protein
MAWTQVIQTVLSLSLDYMISMFSSCSSPFLVSGKNMAKANLSPARLDKRPFSNVGNFCVLSFSWKREGDKKKMLMKGTILPVRLKS